MFSESPRLIEQLRFKEMMSVNHCQICAPENMDALNSTERTADTFPTQEMTFSMHVLYIPQLDVLE